MPVDEHDESSRPQSPETDPSAPTTGGDAPGMDASAAAAAPPPTPSGRRRRTGWHRVVNRRSAMWTGIVAVVALVALVIIALFLYRSGQVDRIITRQIIDTLAQYNVRAEVGAFETKFGPRTAELRDLRLYDSVTGAPLGRVERLVATIRIEDMWALNLRRNVNLESLTIDGLELWVKYDAEGRSNFANIKLPEPDPNRRILFSYSTARVRLNNAVVHYDDRRYDISGEARNVRALVEPDDPNAPEESRMNRVDLFMTDSTFAYNGRPVDHIDIEAHARLNQTRAEITDLILRSPVTESRLSGTLDDWRNLRYRMQINSTVDLTQMSDVLQSETTLRGAGQFTGTVVGEGDQYTVEGQVVSDALAADGVRLKALNINATAKGRGETYEAQGRAVAEMLTTGDFQLSALQIAGGVMGTGTDFRWLGELRAAAARSGATGITGLMLRDALAEMRDGRLTGGAGTFTAQSLTSEGTRVTDVRAGSVTFDRAENGATSVTARSASAGRVVSNGATVNGLSASGVVANVDAANRTNLTVEQVRVGGVVAEGARTGSINIAGVRLAIYGGRVEGSSGDVNVGTVALANGGRADGVRLARPVFVLEPGGRYRASADLSLGGGVLGQMNIGPARSAVLATNDQIQLNNLDAQIFGGHARGQATIATTTRGTSRVAANFTGVDVGGLIATASGNVVPLTGAATGTVNLSFPGTNFEAASGRLEAQFDGATGREERGRTPLTGDLAVNAERGLFRIERANLRTEATELNASGQFSFEGDSNLAVNLNSRDAAELQRVLVASGLVPEVENQIDRYGIEIAGGLQFNGTLTGNIKDPLVNGHFSLDTLALRGRTLGALSADIASTAGEVRINGGQLNEPDGGGVQFTALIPRTGTDNISFDATLDRANVANILTSLGSDKQGGGTLSTDTLSGLGPASGRISVTGFPGAMSGAADVRVGAGRIGTQAYEEIVTRATFTGSRINLETLDARLPAGLVNASGTVDLESQAFDLRARGENVRLDLLAGMAGGTASRLPPLSGIANFNATASGNLADPSSYRIELNAQGRDVTINGQPAGELTLTGRTTADQKFNVELTTGLFGRPQTVRASVDFGSEDLAAEVETTLTGTDLTPLFAALLPGSNVRVTGTATGTLRASGNLLDENGFTAAGLRGRAEFTELSVQVEDVTLAAENPLIVLFTPSEVTFERTRFTGPGTDIIFGGTAALAAGGTQNLSVNGNLNLRVLNNLSPNIFMSGVARVSVRVTGTFAAPSINGTASLANASVAALVTDERLIVNNINGLVRFNANQAQIETLTGNLGGGRVSVAGGALLTGQRPFSLTVNADNVTVPFNDVRATADADLRISGRAFEGQLIEGLVNLRRAEYTQDIDLADLIDRRGEASIAEGGGGGGFGGTTQVALQIEGRDALVVRNNLADVVGSLSLRVRGPIDDPVISGRITATRGTLAFRNDRYEIQRAFIDLPPRRDADPILNIQAESEVRGYRITVGLSGPLSQPVTSLRSDPALPQADVVALITTGNLATGEQGASTLVQSGVGTATSLLTESLFNAPVRRATDKLFGLNRFEIDPLIVGRGGASPTARLTVGRQVNRNLSVTYSTNVTGEPNQVVALEYRVSDRLSFVAQYQQGSANTLRTQSNNFNFEVRFRKRY